jgi:non-ribosomal peptide synthetase component F
MEYCTALFDAETVERWSQQFSLLLHQLCKATETESLTISDLSVMPDAEHSLVQGFSMAEERPEYVSAPFIHDAFDIVAASSPEKRCLCYEEEWLSYGEVAKRVAAAASRLASLGVGPGVVVGLLLERDFDLVISILAVLKAGGCYLPCDPSYPDDRLEVYLEDAKAALLLANPQHVVRAKGLVGEDVPVVDVSTAAAAGPDVGSSALRSPGPDDPAYIIFTSGSTGRPKGVVIAHRGLRDLVPWLVDRHNVGTYLLLLPSA